MAMDDGCVGLRMSGQLAGHFRAARRCLATPMRSAPATRATGSPSTPALPDTSAPPVSPRFRTVVATAYCVMPDGDALAHEAPSAAGIGLAGA